MEKIKPDVREKALEHGFSYLFDEELIMLILGSGTRGLPVEYMAERIADVLDDCDFEDLMCECGEDYEEYREWYLACCA